MSPKEVKITSGRAAMARARSMVSRGVTQTGQPGPWTRVISGGSSWSMPWRMMEWVWPPQISMMVQGRVTVAAMRPSSALASWGSRYSSRCFTDRSFRATSAPGTMMARRLPQVYLLGYNDKTQSMSGDAGCDEQ